MKLKKKDFIEIEFTARVRDGEVFDSNIKKDLEKLDSKAEAKPFIFSLGQGMFLKGVDNALIGKDLGKHRIELEAKDAFGLRDAKLVQRMPVRVFKEHNLNPIPGIVFNFDGRMGKVLTSSGGRVIVDFNNPVAGKDVIYDINVKRKVSDKEEQIKSFMAFIFKKEFKFEIKEKKLRVYAGKAMIKPIEMFADKFKELFGLELEVKENIKNEK